MTIGERIKERRLERGLTLRQLGNLVGVSEATVQRYESGAVQGIAPAMLNKLAQALETTVSWLVGEHEGQHNAAAAVALSQTEHLLLKLYREFSPEQKSVVRSIILSINALRTQNAEIAKELEFAEEFIDSTEYASDYRNEKDDRARAEH